MLPPADIRLLTPNDWCVFRSIRLRALRDAPHAFGSILADALTRTEDDWRALLAGRAQFLATTAGTDIGTVAGLREATPGEGSLISMWVAPQARGTGVSDLLVKSVIAWAAEQKLHRLLLDVTEGNTHAENLYSRNGFRRSGKTGVISPQDPRPEFEMIYDDLAAKA